MCHGYTRVLFEVLTGKKLPEDVRVYQDARVPQIRLMQLQVQKRPLAGKRVRRVKPTRASGPISTPRGTS